MARRFTQCIARDAGTGQCSTYRGGTFCVKHAQQYRNGIIDGEGKKLRNLLKPSTGGWGGKRKKMYTECIAKNNSPCGGKYTGGRFCGKHNSQYYFLHIIDWNGNKIREFIPKKKFTECAAKKLGGCSKFEVGRFCKKHAAQFHRGYIDKEGNRIKELKNPHEFIHTGCIAKNAGTGPCSEYRNGRFCGKHQRQYAWHIIDWNGKRLRKKLSEEKCGIPGCTGSSGFRYGYCLYHYNRIIRDGHIEEVPMPVTENTMRVEKVGWLCEK